MTSPRLRGLWGRVPALTCSPVCWGAATFRGLSGQPDDASTRVNAGGQSEDSETLGCPTGCS